MYSNIASRDISVSGVLAYVTSYYWHFSPNCWYNTTAQGHVYHIKRREDVSTYTAWNTDIQEVQAKGRVVQAGHGRNQR